MKPSKFGGYEWNCSCGSFWGGLLPVNGKVPAVLVMKEWEHMARGHKEISHEEWMRLYGPPTEAGR